MSVNIRMTAVRLESGGLWMHAPVAPTDECVRLVEELGEEVRFIVLPTTAVSWPSDICECAGTGGMSSVTNEGGRGGYYCCLHADKFVLHRIVHCLYGEKFVLYCTVRLYASKFVCMYIQSMRVALQQMRLLDYVKMKNTTIRRCEHELL